VHKRERQTPWFALSIIAHVILLLALVYFTPLREIVIPDREPDPPTIPAEKLKQLNEQIAAKTSEQIASNLMELRRVLGEMDEIERTMDERFEQFEQRRQQDAAEEAAESMERAIERMREAVEAMEQGSDERPIDRAQAAAEHAQDRAIRKLVLLEMPEQVQAAQLEAADQHVEAKQAQREAADRESIAAGRAAQLEQRREEGKPIEQQHTQPVEAARQQADQAREQAVDQQRAAIQKQQQALEKLKEEIERRGEQGPAQPRAQQQTTGQQADSTEQAAPTVTQTAAPAEAPETTGSTEADEPRETLEQVAGKPIAEMYDEGREIEDEIADELKQVRAMDLAMVLDLKLEEALGDITVQRPDRPDLDEALLNVDVQTHRQFEQAKQEQKKALRETIAMVSLAHQMLEMARQSVEDAKFGTDVAVNESGFEAEEEELELIIENLAMEDVGGQYVDMTQVMGQPETEEEAPEVAEDSAPREQLDYDDMTEELERLREQASVSINGEAEGTLPQLMPEMVRMGGRRLSVTQPPQSMPGGQPAKWMYIDTWWTIGPFPNPQRQAIDRKFPPDDTIDLDATYLGKGGRPIQWEFVQSDGPRVMPAHAEEYGVWYAYTELHVDAPTHALLAVGSDDRGILYLNGRPVWISSKRLKGWDIDESWRKVPLRAGTNRLLFRLENGWLNMGFSVAISLQHTEMAD